MSSDLPHNSSSKINVDKSTPRLCRRKSMIGSESSNLRSDVFLIENKNKLKSISVPPMDKITKVKSKKSYITPIKNN